MSALKKTVISHNISYILENNLLVFFFNYNHVSIEEWRVLKNQFSKINQVRTLVVKNKIGNRIVRQNTEENIQHRTIENSLSNYLLNKKTEQSFEKIYTLFQGPTFLIGINSPEQSKQIFNIVKKEKKLVFVGGLYQEKQINHLDLDRLLIVEKTAYTSLIHILQSSLYITLLYTYSNNLYYWLKCNQNKQAGTC